MPPKSRAKKRTAPRKGKKRDELVSDDDSYDDISVEDAVEALDSDNLDDMARTRPSRERRRRQNGS